MFVRYALCCVFTAFSLLFAEAQTRVEHTAEGWQVENTAIRLKVLPDAGKVLVLDKRCNYLWQSPHDATIAIRNVQTLPDGVLFETDLLLNEGKRGVLRVAMQVPAKAAEVHVTAEALQPEAAFTATPFLPPLILDTPRGALAVADYANGQLYSLDMNPFPARWRWINRLDLPLIGVVDTEKGFGYALIVETSDDAVMECKTYRVGERELAAPQIIWWAQKGKFGYPRRLIYHFVAQGGYVAIAKAYRAYAKQHGLLVTLREKAKRNPNLHRLFGAADVWGVWGVDYAQFVREAKLLGVDKLILHGTASPQAMQQAVQAGYLTSEYDNYTDIQPAENEEKIDSTHDLLPDSAVLRADSERMTAWRTMEGVQFMKRCPALWVRTARKVIPPVLQQRPFLARFIDVTTAEGLYECYDPKHPLTHSQKRECGQELLAYVRSLGLVVGGEHGIWWGVPYLDYIEGMMSGGRYSWPAGHLIRPESKEQRFTDPWGSQLPPWSEYEKWGIGHRHRIPLWELVFHDCVVSTWYWGDSSDWLLQAAPEVTDKKDLFNILYGTIPLMWLDPQGAWNSDRQRFIRTYRLTSQLHEAVALQEMLSHEFLTPDRAVQRTRFADGTVCVVNFGEQPYTLKVRNRTIVLPANGFWVKGPRIEQSRVLVNGETVTTVRADGYFFREASSEWVFLRRMDNEHVRVEAFSKRNRVRFNLRDVVKQWDRRTLLVYSVSPQDGRRETQTPYGWQGDGQIELAAGTDWRNKRFYDVLWGKHTRRPDVALNLQVLTSNPVQGKPIAVKLTVRNRGFASAASIRLAIYADEQKPACRLWQGETSLNPRAERTLSLYLDSSRLDGNRILIAGATLGKGIQEITGGGNIARTSVHVQRDLSRWDTRMVLRVEAGKLDREDEIVIVPVQAALFAAETVRAYLLNGSGERVKEIPAQCDRIDGHTEVAFVIPGRMPSGSVQRVAIYGMRRTGAALPPRAPHLWFAEQPVVLRETYTLQLRDGVPRNLATANPEVYRRLIASGQTLSPSGEPFISQLVFSSGRTGWVEEEGVKPARVELLAHGPVRTIVQVSRELRGGVTYTKRYAFYPQFFDVQIDASTSEATYSRAFYAQPGNYEDNGGVKAQVDGKGEAEGVMGATREPRWYAVYTPRWAHACLALTPVDGIVYWDSSAMGGIGFNTARTQGVRFRYVILPGAESGLFAEQWYRRAVEPVKASLY
ncbi:MAG: glycoside hydrolase [bacterium]|nr:glycoside hydrolase [bacterium]